MTFTDTKLHAYLLATEAHNNIHISNNGKLQSSQL